MTIPNLPIEDIIRAKFLTLPEAIQKTIKAPETAAAFRRIANRNGLVLDQTDDLENEALFVMLGLEPPNDFVENLRKGLNISIEKARAVGQDVNQEIFRPIKDELKLIHSIGKDEVSTLPSPTPLTVPKSPIPSISTFEQNASPKFSAPVNPALGHLIQNQSRTFAPASMDLPTKPSSSTPSSPSTPSTSTPKIEPGGVKQVVGIPDLTNRPELQSPDSHPAPFDPVKITTPPEWKNKEENGSLSRDEVLKEIEAAGGLRTPSGDILTDKLTRQTTVPRKETNYAIKKEEEPLKPGQDPYREAVD